MNDEITAPDPVIDLTAGLSIDDVDHPFTAAEHVLALARGLTVSSAI